MKSEPFDWDVICNDINHFNFSNIGCAFPKDLDSRIWEVFDIVFNKIYFDPKSELFFKKKVSYGNINEIENSTFQFTEEQFDILYGTIHHSEREEVISIIGIVLWFEKNDFKAAQKSIEAYKKLFDKNKINNKSKAVTDALSVYNLLLQLNYRDKANEFIQEIIDVSIKDNQGNYFTNNLLSYLVKFEKFEKLDYKKKEKYKDYLNQKAADLGTAIFAGELLLEIAKKENNIPAQKNAWESMAKAWEKISTLSKNPPIREIDLLRKAAECFKAAGEETKANECLFKSQKLSKNQDNWHSHKISIDLNPLIDKMSSKLESMNIINRICYISSLTKISKKNIQHVHQDQIDNREKGTSFYGAFREQSIDENGIIRSNRKGINFKDDTNDQPYLMNIGHQPILLQANIIDTLNYKYVLSQVNSVCFSEIIDPMLPKNKLMVEYIIQMVLSNNSELVVESLMVTFESLLSSILENNGISSIKENFNDGTQEDLTMGPLIKTCQENQLINADDLFLLELVLCNKDGLNLRNLSNHRLTDDSKRSNKIYIFCTYLLIRLLVEYRPDNTDL